MQKLRNATADVLVGIVVVLLAFWVFRGVFRAFYWVVTMVVIVVVVGVVLRIASKLRG